MKFLKISLTLFLLLLTSSVFWLDAPKNIILDKANQDSLEISWDKVDWAWIYAVSFWTVSWSWTSYEHELEVLSDESAKAIIENLNINTEYYIAVKSYDTWDEQSDYSEEVKFSTIDEVWSLKINSSNLLDTRNIDLVFNTDLDNDSSVYLNIVNKDNSFEDIEVENYTIIWDKLKILLNSDLIVNDKYSITIITLDWSNWETIKSWVDWIVEFIVEEDTKVYWEIENTIELPSADDEPEVTISDNTDDQEDKNIVTAQVAKDTKDLPTTGPAETLLFLLFSLIAWGLFLNLRRKINL